MDSSRKLTGEFKHKSEEWRTTYLNGQEWSPGSREDGSSKQTKTREREKKKVHSDVTNTTVGLKKRVNIRHKIV